jgi:Contractile injection system spike tip protein
MPSDFIVKTGDMVKITIPPPVIVPAIQAPVPLKGSSTDVQVNEQFACLQGDELPQSLRGPLPYTAPPFVTPGTGTLTLTLNPSNLTVESSNGQKILIKGQTFTATFTVQSPAMQPTPGGPVPDPLAVKPGTAQFITTNATVYAG